MKTASSSNSHSKSTIAISVALVVLLLAACGRSPIANHQGAALGGASSQTSSPAGQPGTANEQGGWESSGGGGVACFPKQSDADEASSALKAKGYLTSAFRAKILSLTTLDSFENLVDADEYSKAGFYATPYNRYTDNLAMLRSKDLLALKTRSEILKRVARLLSLDVPLFAERMQALEQRFPVNDWQNSAQIGLIADSNPKKVLPKNCVFIQLANRYTQSTHGEIPKTKIVFDKELFEKYLSPYEQAILVMHEYVYEIAREGGHKNSDVIRRLTALFFSLENPPDMKVTSVDALLMRQALDTPLGDYMRFFLKDADFKPSTDRQYSQSSRYDSFISMMVKLRDQMQICLKQKKSQADCQDQTINQSSSQLGLTPEESFLFLARFYFDQGTSNIEVNKYNSEMLTVRNLHLPETAPYAIQNQMRLYCDQMDQRPAIVFLKIEETAKLYCKAALGMAIHPLADQPLQRKAVCYDLDHGWDSFKVQGPAGSQQAFLLVDSKNLSTMLSPAPPKLVNSEITGRYVKFDIGGEYYEAKESYFFDFSQARGGDGDYIFKLYAKLSPKTIESVEFSYYKKIGDVNSTASKTLTGPEAAQMLQADKQDESFIQFDNVTVKFNECQVLNSSLPYSANRNEEQELDGFIHYRLKEKSPFSND